MDGIEATRASSEGLAGSDARVDVRPRRVCLRRLPRRRQRVPGQGRLARAVPRGHPEVAAGFGAASPSVTRASSSASRRTPASRTPPPEVERLTSRELDVLDLVARGLLERRARGASSSSARTAKAHVSSILAKLGSATACSRDPGLRGRFRRPGPPVEGALPRGAIGTIMGVEYQVRRPQRDPAARTGGPHRLRHGRLRLGGHPDLEREAENYLRDLGCHELVLVSCRTRNHVPTVHWLRRPRLHHHAVTAAREAGHVHLLELDQFIGAPTTWSRSTAR